ncbi:endonuclease 4 [uncultured archaeon]|nr:endonuclease 4 [uncultured archaeon]
MDMKLAISTWAYLNLSLPEALERISRLSDRAEIICESRHSLFRPENIEVASSFSLEYTVHGLVADINIASIYPEFRETSVALHRRAIEASSRIGSELYIIHPGYNAWSFCWRDARLALDQSLSELAPLQEELGIRLAVENMPRSEWLFFNKPDVDLHGMGLVLDVGHAQTCGTLSDFLCHPALSHVHLHDNSGNGDEHLALGRGCIDLMPVLKVILEKKISAALEQKTEEGVLESLETLKRLTKPTLHCQIS